LCISTGPGLFRILPPLGSGGSAGACDGVYALDFNAYASEQTLDPNLVAGAQVDVQLWYRDPPNPGGANLTDALRFVICQ